MEIKTIEEFKNTIADSANLNTLERKSLAHLVEMAIVYGKQEALKTMEKELT